MSHSRDTKPIYLSTHPCLRTDVRTVYSFNMQEAMLSRYREHLRKPLQAGKYHAWFLGASMGMLFASIFATYAVVM